MGIFQLLFGFSGRITRSQFWLGQLALAVVVIAVFLIWGIGFADALGPDFQSLHPQEQNAAVLSLFSGLAIAGVVATVLACWICAALCVKRLHDRGKAGWSTLLYIVPSLASLIAPVEIAAFLTAAVTVWCFVELGFLKGDDGANQFGPGFVTDPAALVSREIAELERAALARNNAATVSVAVNTPVKSSSDIAHARTARSVADDRPAAAGFGRRSPRIA